ncbi:MAG: class I SAM-dependent methyltransferase, partial [Promethearchaeota archaeon]
MTKEKYNLWSDFYDQDNNSTRDLDHLIVRRLIQKFKNKKIIEIGCGTGKNTILLSKVATHVLSIDFSKGMLEKAKIKMRDKKNVEFKFADITEKWPCENNYYDIVMCSLVLEHIENIYFVFSEAYRVLIESGEFFINEYHPFRQYQSKRANFQKNGKKIE